MLADLREGWREFAGRPWLWVIVVQFAVVNAVIGAAESVYGPLVARDSLGGAGPWGLALATFGAGTVAGAAADDALETTPAAARRHPLRVPAGPAVRRARRTGAGRRALRGDVRDRRDASRCSASRWMTALHQEIPEDKLSRVSAYDWFGSVAMLPLATALAGPAEHAFGRTRALWGCAVLIVVVTAGALSVPDVRNLTRRTKKVTRDTQEAPVKGELESAGG